MTPQDKAYERICVFLGRRPVFRSCFEHQYVFAFRMAQGQRLCVIKESGEVMWEDDLPDELYPEDAGKQIPLWDHI